MSSPRSVLFVALSALVHRSTTQGKKSAPVEEDDKLEDEVAKLAISEEPTIQTVGDDEWPEEDVKPKKGGKGKKGGKKVSSCI